MRSLRDRRDSGNTDDAGSTVQDTLDAFDTLVVDQVANAPTDGGGDGDAIPSPTPEPHPTRQESIDRFSVPSTPPSRRPQGSSRAIEGLALEMAMERVALTEAVSGISRDELVITIAREVRLPLERLDLVDGYLTDLELEGKLRLVGDLVVLRHPDDGDLLALDLTDEEFLSRYRRRYLAHDGGGTG